MKCGVELPDNANFCPKCGTSVGPLASGNADSTFSSDSPESEDTQSIYDVFLSYSHLDRDRFGMAHILRIKEEIERALADIVDHPLVFLDVEALNLGDLWHSRIMESLNQCKAFVCLVSDQYLNSDYCTRERIWWAAKQTRDGRFLDLPYPVYFVRLSDKNRPAAKDLMSVEMDRACWFDSLNQLKITLREDFIRERLRNITTAVRRKFEKAEKAKSYCSVLPPLYENFVGRITELRELHEYCRQGKYPVIQAFGGVGKTELAAAYAYGFAHQYPMGRFLFRMEGVASWDEAFASALDMSGIGAGGGAKRVSEELDIRDELLEKKDRRKLHRAAAEAFLKRAEKGELLILLDNLDKETPLLRPEKMRDFLCGIPIPRSMHILATTRDSFRFGERDPFISYELHNLKDEEAFEMLCLTGNGQYPFDRCPPTAENGEYRAAQEVIRLLDGHAWSMEIVSAFMADNYGNGFTFSMELDALRKKNLLAISAEFGTYREADKETTVIQLLRPTLDWLENVELGAEIRELAVFAACFNADDIPLYLLEEYWKLNFLNTVCSKGVPFAYAVNRLVKYHLLRWDGGNCKMHRLVQSVFLMHKGKYLPKIVKTLPKCLFIPARFWVPMLLNNPELIDICPQDGTLRSDDWEKLLADPVFAEKMPRESFIGRQWAYLLQYHPEYASADTPWNSLDGSDWCGLLMAQPQFDDRCDWNKVWDELNGRGWADLLREQPQFADKCDWRALDPWDFAYLLEKQPQFAGYCNWSNMDGHSLEGLLKSQPQLADHLCDFRYFSGNDWVYLLRSLPQFADKCNWSILDGIHWQCLLEVQPQFANKCDWTKLDGGNWASLLEKQPQFANKCDWTKLDGENWASLLEKQPQFAELCDWDKLGGSDWASLLEKQPQFAELCDWNKLDGGAWTWLLRSQPEFADKCEWSKLDGRNWALLLETQPQFANKCDWNKLDGRDWRQLLEKRPQFADKCELDKLSEKGIGGFCGKSVRSFGLVKKTRNQESIPK